MLESKQFEEFELFDICGTTRTFLNELEFPDPVVGEVEVGGRSFVAGADSSSSVMVSYPNVRWNVAPKLKNKPNCGQCQMRRLGLQSELLRPSE